MKQQVVKIKSIKPVTHNVLQIVTEKPQNLSFTPGQAAEISINKEGWKNEKGKIVNPKEFNLRTESPKRLQPAKSNLQKIISIVFGSLLMLFAALPASAHCDSYDGPVIKDATKALETNNVNLVLKWITDEQEKEIIPLFNKTYSLKNGDKEVYAIVEKHFFETLVRLHRETEGAPYTGLKPAGTTKPIIQMTDKALKEGNVDEFLVNLNSHIDKVVREKYQKVAELDKVKDNSKEQGRAFVEAYVDYTHSVEALHDIMEQGGGHTRHLK